MSSRYSTKGRNHLRLSAKRKRRGGNLRKLKKARLSSTQPGGSTLQVSNLDPVVAEKDNDVSLQFSNLDPVVAEKDNDASPKSSGCDTSLPTAEHHLHRQLRGRRAPRSQGIESSRQSSDPAEGNYRLKKIVAKYKYFMCRLCLCERGTLVDIHGCSVGSGYIPSALISGLLQLEVSGRDIYPQLVCLECLKKLTTFQKFKDSCWRAKVKFDTLHFSMALPRGTGGMCDEVNVVNNGDVMETSEEYSNQCTEEQEEEGNISEIDIKEEPIEESIMRDPLRLESPQSDLREIPEEDITIKEEEIQINQRLSVEEAAVTLVEKTGKITVPQVNQRLSVEEAPVTFVEKMEKITVPQVTSELPKENNMVKETIVNSKFSEASSSSIFSFPDCSSVQPSLQGHIQSNNNTEKVGLNGGNVDGVQMKMEHMNYTADEIMVGERVQNSTVDGSKQSKNLIEDGENTGRNEGNIPSVQYFCKQCCKIFISMVELDNHNCAKEVVKNFECKVCGRKSKTEKILWRHIQKHNLNIRFYCQICCKGFLSEKDLSKHFYLHKNNSLPLAVAASNPVSSIPSEGIVNDTGQIQRNCNQEVVVPNSNDATNSMKKQSNNWPQKSNPGKACTICSRIYCNPQYLKKHMLTQHSRTIIVRSEKFPTEKEVESSGFGNNDTYHCDVCGARFFVEDDLLIHMSVHARNDPFQCDCCGKKYNHKRLLWSHIAECHRTSI